MQKISFRPSQASRGLATARAGKSVKALLRVLSTVLPRGLQNGNYHVNIGCCAAFLILDLRCPPIEQRQLGGGKSRMGHTEG